MYHVDQNTLAGMKVAPMFWKRMWAEVPSIYVAKRLRQYNPTLVYVESEALRFYAMNHVFSLIGANRLPMEHLSPLETKLARYYVRCAGHIAKRLVYYTVMICTREARHLGSMGLYFKELSKQFGLPFSSFIQDIRNKDEISAIESFKHETPDCSFGTYVSGLTHIFNNGSWAGGYGGPKWGNIAEQLRKLVHGEMTFEMFADTAFTLCHNGGPMFNKGMLYHGYGKNLYTILDVQRSGQIPELCFEKRCEEFSDSDLMHMLTQTAKLFPDAFGQYVNWYKVEALGSIKKYPTYKQEQLKKYGPSPETTDEEKQMAKRFYITPSEYVVKIERKKVKA